MKHSRLLLIFILLISPLMNAQAYLESGYVYPQAEYSLLNGHPLLMWGGRAMWMLNNHLSLGGAVYISQNAVNSPFSGQTGSFYSMDMSIIGVRVDYVYMPENNFVITAGALIGGGSLEFHNPDNAPNEQQVDPRGFSVIEPGITAGYSVSPYSALSIGYARRIIFNYTDNGGLPASSIGGNVFQLGIITHPKPIESHGGYVAPVLKQSVLNGQAATLLGGRAMWLMDGQFGIGGGVYTNVNTVNATIKNQLGDPYRLTLSYGGLELEYRFLREQDFYITTGLLCAGGDVKYFPPSSGSNNQQYYPAEMLIWEPRVEIGYLPYEYLSVSAGVSYREVTQYTPYYNLGRDQIQKPAFTLSISIGKFK